MIPRRDDPGALRKPIGAQPESFHGNPERALLSKEILKALHERLARRPWRCPCGSSQRRRRRDSARSAMPAEDTAVALDPLAAGTCWPVLAAAADIAGLYWLAEERDPGLDNLRMIATETPVAIGGMRREECGR